MNLLQEIQSKGDTMNTESSRMQAELKFVYLDQQRIGQSGTVTPDNGPEFLRTYIIGTLHHGLTQYIQS